MCKYFSPTYQVAFSLDVLYFRHSVEVYKIMQAQFCFVFLFE